MKTDPDEVKFDLDLTRRNFDHDEALLREIGGIFIEDVPVLVEQLIELRLDLVNQSERGDFVVPHAMALGEAKRVAHSIKGLAATFGAQPLVKLAQEIEDSPQCSLDCSNADKVQRLSDVARRTVKELAAQLSLKSVQRSSS
jgi:HPt (histidine-containing phosphotransfer) domain-containing protein